MTVETDPTPLQQDMHAALRNSLAMASFNQGDWAKGCRRLSMSDAGRPVWSFTSHINPKTGIKTYTFIQGLANRRQAETSFCRQGIV